MEKVFIVLKEVGRQIIVILAKIVYWLVMGVIAICKYISNKSKSRKRADSRPIYTVIENAVPKKQYEEVKKNVVPTISEPIQAPVIEEVNPIAQQESVVIDFSASPSEEPSQPVVKMVFSEETVSNADVSSPAPSVESAPEVSPAPASTSTTISKTTNSKPKKAKAASKPKLSGDPRDRYSEGSLF